MIAIIGCGARNWTDRDLVYAKLDGLLERFGSFTLVEGTAPGGDAICGAWAKRESAFNSAVGHHPMPAEWKVHAEGWCPAAVCGPDRKDHCVAAGFRRNQAMVDWVLANADEQFVIAFKDNFGRGPTGGTEDLVRRATSAKIHGVKISHRR